MWLLLAVSIFFADGFHGGYFLSDREGQVSAFQQLFSLLEKYPSWKVSLEYEPYTLERMLTGARLPGEVDLEKWPEAWTLWWQCPADFSLDEREFKEGRRSLKVRLREDGGWANISQPLRVEGHYEILRGKVLVFSAWVKGKNCQAGIYIDAHTVEGLLKESIRATSLEFRGEEEWKKVSVEFPVPKDAIAIHPTLTVVRGSSGGEAWFDSVSLKEKETGKEWLRNGGFENPIDFKAPQVLDKLREFVKKGRIEIVGGTYTQPVWVSGDGEQWIRQFLLGLEAVKKTLGVDVKVYACQEAGFISQLPQILQGLGYKGCLLRALWGVWGNPPVGGKEKVLWEGPDGSRIEAVPHYTPTRFYHFRPEELWPSFGVVRRLEEVGIRQPLFVDLRDFHPEWVLPYEERFLRDKDFSHGWVALAQPIDASPYKGKVLIFSCWAKTSLPGAHIHIDAPLEDGEHTPPVRAFCPPDGKWHKLEVEFLVPQNAIRLHPHIKIWGREGDAFFDNLSLVVKGTQEEILNNPSFEEGESFPQGWVVWSGEGITPSVEWTKEAFHGKRSVRLRFTALPLPVSFVTLSDYFQLLPPAHEVWRDPWNKFSLRFPWGVLGGELQRTTREAQRALEVAERLLVLLGKGREKEFLDTLWDGWRMLLMAEHHDTITCFPSKFGIWARGPWKDYAELGLLWTREVKKLSERVIQSLARKALIERENLISVFNPSGASREEVILAQVSFTKAKFRTLSVIDEKGHRLPCEVRVKSLYSDGAVKEAEVLFRAKVDGFSLRSFRLVEGGSRIKDEVRVMKQGDEVIIENGILRLLFKERQGLCRVWFRDKVFTNGDILISGFFPDSGKDEKSRIEEVRVIENGSLRAIVEERGFVGPIRFVRKTTLRAGERHLTIELELDFGEGVRVGSAEGRRFKNSPWIGDWAEEEKKLRFLIPLAFEVKNVFCDQHYDVREVQKGIWGWAVSWIVAQGEGIGLSLVIDRNSSFRCNGDLLEVVMAYGGHHPFAPGGMTLPNGKKHYKFILLCFEGNWEREKVPLLADALNRPTLVIAGMGTEQERLESFKIEPEEVLVGAAYKQEEGIIIRLFNPFKEPKVVKIFASKAKKITLVDLRGKAWKGVDLMDRIVKILPKQILTIRVEE